MDYLVCCAASGIEKACRMSGHSKPKLFESIETGVSSLNHGVCHNNPGSDSPSDADFANALAQFLCSSSCSYAPITDM